MQHRAGAISIGARQGPRDVFHDGIAHRVRMSDTFPFDDFDVEMSRLRTTCLLNVDRVHVFLDPFSWRGESNPRSKRCAQE